jgi:hypothetical protein
MTISRRFFLAGITACLVTLASGVALAQPVDCCQYLELRVVRSTSGCNMIWTVQAKFNPPAGVCGDFLAQLHEYDNYQGTVTVSGNNTWTTIRVINHGCVTCSGPVDYSVQFFAATYMCRKTFTIQCVIIE